MRANLKQTVGELLNFTYDKPNVWIMYLSLFCPITFIPINQKGEKYNPKKHNKFQVSSWSIGTTGKLTGKIIVIVDAPRELIPQALKNHSKGKHLKNNIGVLKEEQLSIFDMEAGI